nr:enoyl-CoA hydratase/isomerase family protein [Sphingomonas laterariae]
MPAYETLDYAMDDGIVVITLARPERHNALNSVMDRELPLAWRRFEEDPEARVAIITGSGRAFCVGADLADLPRQDETVDIDAIRWTSLQNRVWKPVIAAVNGMACGGGLHFVADSDIVLAADHATFFDPHVAVGLASVMEPICLARRMPLGAVLRLALVGGSERLSAGEALRLGMVDEVLAPDRLMARARELAALIKRHSPSALKRSKQAIWEAQELGLTDALKQGWRHIEAQMAHPDVSEGAQAFLERRPAQWRPYEPDGEV